MLLKIHDRKVIFVPAFLGGYFGSSEDSRKIIDRICLTVFIPEFLLSILHSLAGNNFCSFLYFSPKRLCFSFLFFFGSTIPPPQKKRKKISITRKNVTERESFVQLDKVYHFYAFKPRIILTKFVLTRSYKLVTVVILRVVSCVNKFFPSAEWKTIFSFPWLKFSYFTS